MTHFTTAQTHRGDLCLQKRCYSMIKLPVLNLHSGLHHFTNLYIRYVYTLYETTITQLQIQQLLITAQHK